MGNLDEARLRADDRQRVFERLVKTYQRRLSRALSLYLSDRAEREDVLQETFFRAYQALPTFRGESAFYTWLYRIAVNLAKNYLVAKKRRASRQIDLDDANVWHDESVLLDADTPECRLQAKQIRLKIDEALALLPRELKQAIVFREIEGLAYREIAKKMSCPVGTVRSRIFRAREAVAGNLRHFLKARPLAAIAG